MDKSIHILLIIEGTWPWYRGGVSEWIDRYIKAFPNFSFRILQIATDDYRHRGLEEALYDLPSQVDSFKTLPVPEFESLSDQSPYPGWQGDPAALLDDPTWHDVIHVTNTGFAGMLGAQLKGLTGAPLVLTEHALYWKEIEAGTPALECGYSIDQQDGKLAETVSVFKNMAKTVYAKADRVVTVSACNMKEQRRLGAHYPVNIPNGVESGWILDKLPEPSKNGNSTKPVIGWVGRCAEMKRPMRFLELAESFQDKENLQPQFLMLLADAGEHGPEEQVRKKAASIGNLELHWNRDARDYYDRMDALCITSKQESQPLVLWEALARGVMPIGWEAGDVTQEYGFILPQSTPVDKMVQWITELYGTEPWNKKLEQLHQRTKEYHSWDQIFKDYRYLINTLFTEPDPSRAIKETND